MKEKIELKPFSKIPRFCKNCENDISYKGNNIKFCNQKCSKAWHKREYYKRNREDIKEKEKVRGKKKSVCPINRMLKNAKNRASVKNLPFNIDRDDIIIPNICPILNLTMTINENFVGDNSPTLDKIIPNKGYVKGNVRVISHRANRLKCGATAEEMKLILEDLKTIYGK